MPKLYSSTGTASAHMAEGLRFNMRNLLTSVVYSLRGFYNLYNKGDQARTTLQSADKIKIFLLRPICPRSDMLFLSLVKGAGISTTYNGPLELRPCPLSAVAYLTAYKPFGAVWIGNQIFSLPIFFQLIIFRPVI